MHRYRVIEHRADEGVLVLRCVWGQCHEARILSAPPLSGAILEGGKPHVGLRILQCQKSRVSYRVVFESIGQTQMQRASFAMQQTAALGVLAR